MVMTAMSGATGPRLLMTPALLGRTFRVRLSASLKGYTTSTSTAVATSAVMAGQLTTRTPIVTGTAKVGRGRATVLDHGNRSSRVAIHCGVGVPFVARTVPGRDQSSDHGHRSEMMIPRSRTIGA